MAAVALRMPSSYVPVEAEEMEYIEGGGELASLTKSQCFDALASIGVSSPYVIALSAVTVFMAQVMIKRLKKVCAFAGGVLGAIAGWVGAQIINFGCAIIRGAINNGVSISWNWNPFKSAVGINYSVQ